MSGGYIIQCDLRVHASGPSVHAGCQHIRAGYQRVHAGYQPFMQYVNAFMQAASSRDYAKTALYNMNTTSAFWFSLDSIILLPLDRSRSPTMVNILLV